MTAREELENKVRMLATQNEELKAELKTIRSKKTVLLAGVRKMISALEGINDELWDLGATEKEMLSDE